MVKVDGSIYLEAIASQQLGEPGIVSRDGQSCVIDNQEQSRFFSSFFSNQKFHFKFIRREVVIYCVYLVWQSYK